MKMNKQMLWWLGALVVGAILGLLHIGWIDAATGFLATVYTRLFQFLALPTAALAIVTTLISFGQQKSARKIFVHTIVYILLTTLVAAAVGLGMYLLIAPQNLPPEMMNGAETIPTEASSLYEYIVSVFPNNIVQPFLSGNILSVLLISVTVGIALVRMKDSEGKVVVIKGVEGLQELFFSMINGLVRSLPLGITAFAAQFSGQITEGYIILNSVGKYTAVIFAAFTIQFLIILPLFLLARGLNPIKVFRAMNPAVAMAFFTKSSIATLPMMMSAAEKRLDVNPKVSRFTIPICTTINMNGCSAFIIATSLFVMQNGGIKLSFWETLLWVPVAAISAMGSAGMPMGCFFITVSLMTRMGAPVEVMSIILPLYTIFDMFETAENVWAHSCVCAMTNKDLKDKV